MMRFLSRLLAIAVVTAFICPSGQCGPSRRTKLVIFSFDGFRWDYYGTYPTPNLDLLKRSGVHAKIGIQPAFTTKTFPNHYTIATGLYEESHGILDNEMYDPVFNATFHQFNTESRWWEGGEPLWITATKQGVVAGVYFWPGGNVAIKNVTPKHRMLQFDKAVSFESRVNTTIDWLTRGKADLVMAYFHEPDDKAHWFGAFSQEVAKAVRQVDNAVGFLMASLKDNHLLNSTNVIILSDHGMVNRTKGDYIIDLSTILDLTKIKRVMPKYGPVVGILPEGNSTAEIASIVDTLRKANKKMKVYKKQEIPDDYHYKNNRRVLPIIAVAEEGYLVARTKGDVWMEGVGEHGYDNHLRSMRPVFFASGPDFRKGYEFSENIENVDVYPLACELLGIRASPNNGSLTRISILLADGATSVRSSSSWQLILLNIFVYLFYYRK